MVSQKQEIMMFEFGRLARVIRRQQYNNRPIRRGSMRLLIRTQRLQQKKRLND